MAYAFVEAILVTPLGALSVVITAILSSIFLKERLSFIGKIGCFMCIIGSIVIVLNAPAQSSVATIQDMQRFILSPGFLVYAGLVIVGCVSIIIWVVPKYGNKSMMPYLIVCSFIGGLSVVATQGLGAAVVTQISGVPQFNQWFLYVLLVFVVVTLLVEIVYLNKALNIFNAALVTPTYYVIFTSATIVTSAILFRGFKGSPSSIATVVMGFLQICSGVVLLQLSKSSKNVPDTEIFRGDLDQIRTVAEQSEPESEPKADAIRGTAAIIRRLSVARQQAEVDEALRIRRELMRPATADEQLEWDGVRRRATWNSTRRNTLSGHHAPPPIHMARIPDEEEAVVPEPQPEVARGRRRSMSVDEAMRVRMLQEGGGAEPHSPETFLERMRALFGARTQGGKSSVDLTHAKEEPATAAVVGGGDHTRALDSPSTPNRPRFYTSATAAPPPLSQLGMQHSSQSSPHVNHVQFERPRSHSRGSEYKSIPSSLPYDEKSDITAVSGSPTPEKDHGSTKGKSPADGPMSPKSQKGGDDTHLRPDSRGGARRQFSFTFLHRGHNRSESASSAISTTESHHSSGVGAKLPWNKRPGTDRARTEEEMLGLVKGDTASSGESAESRGTSRGGTRSSSPDLAGREKVPDIRVVSEDEDERRWKETGKR
ncbi:magnesium transporter NIPA-domain-containing protein [Pyronema omphalodes]|nr:magnesium transporter NIPA-domain-containing protein [Pyronema omphalodes]